MFKRSGANEIPAGEPGPAQYAEIVLNDPAHNTAEGSFADNYISTTKYTFITFLPVRRAPHSPLLRPLACRACARCRKPPLLVFLVCDRLPPRSTRAGALARARSRAKRATLVAELTQARTRSRAIAL